MHPGEAQCWVGAMHWSSWRKLATFLDKALPSSKEVQMTLRRALASHIPNRRKQFWVNCCYKWAVAKIEEKYALPKVTERQRILLFQVWQYLQKILLWSISYPWMIKIFFYSVLKFGINFTAFNQPSRAFNL